MTAVVEFHAFTDNKNQFIIKELAIVGDSFQTQIVFRSPYCKCVLNQKQQRTARWLSRHFHGIKWEEGSIDYNEDIIRTLCKPFNKIYSKGLEKVRFLNEFHDNVFELPEEGTSSTVVVHNCLLPQHKSDKFKCALRSAQKEYSSILY